jgi:hypothetical protein
MTSTMESMRWLAAAGLAALVLSTAACGGTGVSASGSPGDGAAHLVPPDAVAFVSADARLDSEQWRTVRELFGPLDLPAGLDYDRDVKPAVGDELNLAVLDVHDGKPEAVAIVKPTNEAKLRELAAKFDEGDEHYTVRHVGDWAVVADSDGAFDAVSRAEAGRSLADVPKFRSAMDELGGGSLAVAYAGGGRSQLLAGKLRGLAFAAGLPETIAARVATEDGAIRLQARLQQREPAPVYRPRLLNDVPSGAMLAVSFKNPQRLLERLALEPTLRDATAGLKRTLGVSLGQLAPVLRGEGVFYVAQGLLLPTFVLEIESQNPDKAAGVLRRLAAKSRTVPLGVYKRGNRVFLSNGMALQALAGPKLVDDTPFKDALAAADTPDEVTWLAYADLHRLLPVLQALTQTLGKGSMPSSGDKAKLDRLGTLVAYGARSGSTARVELRVTRH